jgi:hypothetical protein
MLPARRSGRRILRRQPGLLSQHGLAAQPDLVWRLNADHLHWNLIADFKLGIDILNPEVGHFRYVEKALGAGKDFHKRAKIDEPGYRTR